MFTFAADNWGFPKTFSTATPVLYFAIAFPFVLGAFSLLRNSKCITKKDGSQESENEKEGPEKSAAFKNFRDFQPHSLNNGSSDDLPNDEHFFLPSLSIESSSPVVEKASLDNSIPKVDQLIPTLMELSSTLGDSTHKDSRLLWATVPQTPENESNIENVNNHSEPSTVTTGTKIGNCVMDDSTTLGIHHTTQAGLAQPWIMRLSALYRSSTPSTETQNETEENENFSNAQFEQSVPSPIPTVSLFSNAPEYFGPQLRPQLKMGNGSRANTINDSTSQSSNDSVSTEYQPASPLLMYTPLSDPTDRFLFSTLLDGSGTLIYLAILISIMHDTRDKALDYLTKKIDSLSSRNYFRQFNLYLQKDDLLAVKEFFQSRVLDDTSQYTGSELFEYVTLPTLFPSVSLIAFVLYMHDGSGDTDIADLSTTLSNKPTLNGNMYTKRLLHQHFFGFLFINQKLRSDMVTNHKTVQGIKNNKPPITATSLSKLLELKKDSMYFQCSKPNGYKYAEIQNYCLQAVKRFSVPNGTPEGLKTNLNKFLDSKVEMLAKLQKMKHIDEIM